MGAPIERTATVKGSWLTAGAQGQEYLAVQRTLPHRVVIVIGAVDGVVGTHGNAVGPFEQPFAPGPQKLTITIEDDHGMFAAIKGVYSVLGVYSHAGYLLEGPVGR